MTPQSLMQQLQQVVSALGRSLDEREIVHELARGAARILPSDGVVVARVDIERGEVLTLLRLARGEEVPGEVQPLGGGPLAESARTGRPILERTYDRAHSSLAAADDVVRHHGRAGSVLAAPLLVGRQLLGVIALYAEPAGAYADADVDMLMLLAAQAASAISNARLFAESQRERRQSEALAEVARAVGESLRMGEVLRLILRHATALLGTEGGSVSLRQDDYLHVVSGSGIAEVLAGIHIPMKGTLVGRVVREGVPVVVNDLQAEPEFYRPMLRLARFERLLFVPLVTGRGVIGTLAVYNRSTDFTVEDARVLQRLADQVAVAIVNARLYEELAESTREWSVAFNSIASGMVIVDESGRIVRYNDRALQLAAHETQRELAGRRFYEAILHEECEMGRACPLDAALRDGVVGRATVRSAVRDRVFEVIASPHPNGGAVVTFDDVSAVHALAQRNRLIVETTTDAILITDPGRRITYANPAAIGLFGTEERVLGARLAELVPGELAADVEGYDANALGGGAQRYQATIVRHDGEQRVVSVSSAPLRDVGRVTGLVTALRDDTEELRARDAVALSESRYRNLFETASDAIFTLDAHGAFTSANPAAALLLGASRAELLGRAFIPMLDTRDRERTSVRLRDVLGGLSRRFDCTLVRQTGERRLLSMTFTPVRHKRKLIGVLAMARDLTEERRRAAELQRTESRYAYLVESAADSIVTFDAAGRFLSVNRAVEIATGRSRDMLIGEHFGVIVDPRDHAAIAELVRETLAGRRRRRELRYLDTAGVPREATIMAAPVREGDIVVGGLAVVRDARAGERD